MISVLLTGCSESEEADEFVHVPYSEEFEYKVDAFADLEILRYRVPGFEKLSIEQKELLYYLMQAALEGRDIIYDQNGKYNLAVRHTLEGVYVYSQDRESSDFTALETYLKRVWASNGIHHHYGGDKFLPEFSKIWFEKQVRTVPLHKLPLKNGETVNDLLTKLEPVIFDPAFFPKKTNQETGVDLILTSAVNFYDGVTQAEAEAFYNTVKKPDDPQPIAYGLNSQLVKEDGYLVERVYKKDGMYGEAIRRIVFWLKKAEKVAENRKQKAVIEKLIEYYETGDLKKYDDYAILWVKDLNSHIDFVNGFTETYGDPLGIKGSWEALVNFKNIEATARTTTISKNALWFEENSPVDERFKKKKVKGVSAKVITATFLAGDCYPTTPIGINLPNSSWIRAAHGSKSVTIENIIDAYNMAAKGNGFFEEFAWSVEELDLLNTYYAMTNNLHTDLHECLGHGSGKLLDGVDQDALRSYGSVIEEARADLFGLYFIADKKMLKLNILPNEEAFKAEYYNYFMNGLMTQLMRIEPGKTIEEAHMRNRQLITRWVLEKSSKDNAVELKQHNGKTFVVINDYKQVRQYIGELLAEVQRIKSTGDYPAAQELVEKYAVQIDPVLHAEVLERYKKLNIAPYKGFVNPVYYPLYDEAGNFEDLYIDYEEDYVAQQLRYSREYSNVE
jgi:dipeptidyl-peptidase-3